MQSSKFVVSASCLFLGACAPPGPTGPEKAAAYHAEQERLAQEKAHPTPPPEESTTLQFAMCEDDGNFEPAQFPEKSNGAAFRAIVLFKITETGKTTDHCYRKLEGDIVWEENVLGNVEEWSYPIKYAGEFRERLVSYRKTPPASADTKKGPQTETAPAEQPPAEKQQAETPSAGQPEADSAPEQEAAPTPTRKPPSKSDSTKQPNTEKKQ